VILNNFSLVMRLDMKSMSKLIRESGGTLSLEHPARTALASMSSLLVGHLLWAPEAYWAPITTLIVMQSSLGAALPVSAHRFAGTLLGVAAGGVAVTCFNSNAFVFGMAVFVTGMVCAALRLGESAYRFASITLAIIMLVTRIDSVWVVAAHRFAEVSVGIVVGLLFAALWPEIERR